MSKIEARAMKAIKSAPISQNWQKTLNWSACKKLQEI